MDTARRNIRQFISKASFSSAVDKQAALSCVDVLEEAIAARQPVGEPVAKSVGIDALVQLLVDDAEECAKGWVERGDAYASGKSAGLLAAADYFRKIATSQRWSEFLSAPAQAVDLGPVRAALQAAEALCVCCASVDGYSRSELNAFGQNMRSQFTEALALIDSKAVGNG